MGSRRPLWWGCWEDSGRCSWRGNGAVVSRRGLLDHCGAPWLLTLSLLGASGQTSAQKWHDLIRIATRSPFLLCWKWTAASSVEAGWPLRRLCKNPGERRWWLGPGCQRLECVKNKREISMTPGFMVWATERGNNHWLKWKQLCLEEAGLSQRS